MDTLANIIENSGISKTIIAKKLDINRQTLYNWINQDFDLSTVKLQRIGQAINYDFSKHFTDWKKNEITEPLEVPGKAELIQILYDNVRRIEQLEQRMADLELDSIKQKLWGKG